ncbi:MAG: N-acetylmuramoyl-L-alanine amidase [Desulfobaccales bacterium]
MKIKNHRLYRDDGSQYPFRRSPNSGGPVQHEFLVMHYTAGRSAESSIDYLTKPIAKASAHVVIGRDGSITQLVPFDTVAWHAGTSSWDGFDGLNHYSIGIELDNAGVLTRQGNRWKAWFGDTYPDDEVLEAVHKHETVLRGWHLYTEVQLTAALELADLLVNFYKLRDVVGHDDIAPGRKIDPGPAFPMESFRKRILGRQDADKERFLTTTVLNIRVGPGTQYDQLPGSPLPEGTRVEILKQDGLWRFVDVLDEVSGIMDLQGWVHGRYLRRMK